MERINNASWCCDEIEDLIASYKTKYNLLCFTDEAINKSLALIYAHVIQDLENILYGESEYE